ncbi:MAG: AAA family ATPase [Solirubrobacteraceae bacterium MAG38_C4-C5]|nr:AAA family ATPase [Candidatus Siliceabacter maunaloa]
MTFGEAREAAKEWAADWMAARPGDQVVLVWDPAARLRVAARLAADADHDALATQIRTGLTTALGTFFSGDVILAAGRANTRVVEAAWNAGRETGLSGVRLLDRRRSKDDWFEPTIAPWALVGDLDEPRPPIITFASYKGGFGRSTALAATAVGLAREGRRVLVVDLDLEAPGVLSLLPPQSAGVGNASGVALGLVDVLLGSSSAVDATYPARDDPGITVLPAGIVDAEYLQKLARLDYEALVDPGRSDGGPLATMLRELREHFDVMLLDARAGLHDLTGAAVNGTPHLAVLFGRDTDESWAGVALMLRQIGGERVAADMTQQDVVLVYAKAPGATGADETFVTAMRRYEERALGVLTDVYYAQDADEDDELIGVPSPQDRDAQHIPVGVRFDPTILYGAGDVVPPDGLGYGELLQRIRERTGLEA